MFLKNHPDYSALPGARQNVSYAELGIMAIIKNRICALSICIPTDTGLSRNSRYYARRRDFSYDVSTISDEEIVHFIHSQTYGMIQTG